MFTVPAAVNIQNARYLTDIKVAGVNQTVSFYVIPLLRATDLGALGSDGHTVFVSWWAANCHKISPTFEQHARLENPGTSAVRNYFFQQVEAPAHGAKEEMASSWPTEFWPPSGHLPRIGSRRPTPMWKL